MVVVIHQTCIYVMKAYRDHIIGNIYYFTKNVQAIIGKFIKEECTEIIFESDDNEGDDGKKTNYSKIMYEIKFKKLLSKFKKIKRDKFENISIKINH